MIFLQTAMLRRKAVFLALCCLAPGGISAVPAKTPLQGLGVNIHFTEGAPNELDMLSSAFSVTRMDFKWALIESRDTITDT